MTTEEIKTTETQTEQATETEDTGPKKDWEKIAKDAQRRADDAKAKLKAREQAEADLTKQAEEKRLLDAGNYETLISQRDKKHQEEIAAYERKDVIRDLIDMIREQAPSYSSVLARIAKAEFTGTREDMQIFVDQLKSDKDTQVYFQESMSESRPGIPAPAAASVRGASRQSTLDERLKSTDPAVKKAAVSEMFQGMLSGQIPT